MDISIDGLNKRQRALADVIWSIDSPDEVLRFINSLPKQQRIDATIVMSMMIWAMLDTVQDTNLAEEALKKYL